MSTSADSPRATRGPHWVHWTLIVVAGFAGGLATWFLVLGDYRSVFTFRDAGVEMPGMGESMLGILIALLWFPLAIVALATRPRSIWSWLPLILPILLVVGSFFGFRFVEQRMPGRVEFGPIQRVGRNVSDLKPSLRVVMNNRLVRYPLDRPSYPISSGDRDVDAFQDNGTLEVSSDGSTLSGSIKLSAPRRFRLQFSGLRNVQVQRDGKVIATQEMLPPGEYDLSFSGDIP